MRVIRNRILALLLIALPENPYEAKSLHFSSMLRKSGSRPIPKQELSLATVKPGGRFRRVLAKYEEIYCHSDPLFGLTLARTL